MVILLEISGPIHWRPWTFPGEMGRAIGWLYFAIAWYPHNTVNDFVTMWKESEGATTSY